ncbi:MAG: DUF4230 domain-containing protein [Bacteroidota bacterium]
MRKILFGIVITLIIVFGLRYCEFKKDEKETVLRNSTLIQKQLNNVGKLVVTEGNYAQVYTYEDLKEGYFDFLDAKKKALVIVNAKASVSYDLSRIETRIDEENKTVTITSIPEPQLSVEPKIEYYDIQQNYLNPFGAEDYNKIRRMIEDSLRKTIKASPMISNAQNRLISELQKIYILTNSMGWTLQYQEQPIVTEEALETLKL